ncbi:MAG TPA: cupredoxin domain-containing protein [Acidimicrobiales bacterium]|nr:cupredoxin domain-containing protein [Acidimicrobiales bacterium]
MPIRRLLPVAVATAALLLSACGGDDQARGADKTTPSTTTTTRASTSTTTGGGAMTTSSEAMKTHFTVVAKNIAFSPEKLTIPANVDVEVVFDNQDAAVPHNIHFFTPKEVKTDPKNGPEKDTVTLRVDKAGTYDYTCDVHPTMKGDLTVK